MIRRIMLGITFVAALGSASVVTPDTAEAWRRGRGGYGRSFGYYGGPPRAYYGYGRPNRSYYRGGYAPRYRSYYRPSPYYGGYGYGGYGYGGYGYGGPNYYYGQPGGVTFSFGY